MDKQEALERYKKVIDTDIIKYYEDADKYQWYNLDDPDLHPIRTKLPDCPDWDKIENFGLPKEKQVFKREEMSSTLEYLIKKVSMEVRKDKTLTSAQKKEDAFYDRFWGELESSIRYKKTIEWIEQQWYFRVFGKWMFIFGKPVYIPRNHWFYLNYWSLEGVSRPEYRERDREWFWAMQYFKEDTTIPKKDSDGILLYNDDGSLQLEDIGRRTIDGVIVAKSRRAGDTTKSTCDLFCDMTLVIDGNCGIQGDKEDTGEQVFNEKLMYAYRRLNPIWKPKTNQNIQSALLFESSDIEESLNSKIDYASANPTAYDGRKLHRYYADEPGKVDKYSIRDRHEIVRLCLRLGTKLNGFSIYTTTVNDMTATAGQSFEKLCRASFYNERGENGYTKSGMVILHFKADHGCEGFVGPYGESVREKPKEYQLPFIENIKNYQGERVGARDSIMMNREMLRLAGDFEELSQQKRLNPLTFAESFAPPSNNIYFNMDILERRHTELKRDNEATITCDLVGDPNTNVELRINPDGRFKISHIPAHALTNRKYSMNGVWYPQYADSFVASADTFKSDKDRVQGYRMSDGGAAVKWKHDPKIDPETKPISEWQTGRFVCTYRFRPPSTDEFCEDVLKMCVYFGALMYPEENVDHVYKYFVKRGFSGYLLYDTDTETGKPKATPGFHTGGELKKKLFNLTRNYIAAHGMREKHIDYIDECLAIRSPDDMTNFDLFTACGGCLLAEESSYSVFLKEQDTFDIKGALW